MKWEFLRHPGGARTMACYLGTYLASPTHLITSNWLLCWVTLPACLHTLIALQMRRTLTPCTGVYMVVVTEANRCFFQWATS